jgi:predicted acetyltransferase
VLTSLMRATLDAAHERGDRLAVLAASEGGIYGRYGCGPATSESSYTVARSSAALLCDVGTGSDVRGSVVILAPHEAAEAFPAVFDLACRQRAGEVGRLASWWDELLVPEGAADAPMRFLAGYEQDGTIDGYAVYEVRTGAGGQREVVLEECCTTSAAAYAALFAHLLSVDLTEGMRTGARPVDEPLRHMLVDPRALRTISTCDGMWLRLVDAAGALAERRYAAPGRVVLELVDAFCPWNSGRLAVEAAPDGTALVVSTTEEPDLVLDAAALATLYLGGARATTLRSAGRVVEPVPGAAARFDAFLHSDPVPFCTTL